MLPEPCFQAIKKFYPEYFTLSPDEQMIWKANLSQKNDTLYKKIRKYFMIEHLGINQKTINKILNHNSSKDLTPQQQAWLNLHMNHLTGIGNDAFYLNEFMHKNQTLLDFPTLQDYDYDDFIFQEKAREAYSHTPSHKPYKGSLSAVWSRAIIDNKLAYLNLSMLAYYIFFELENMEYDVMNDYLPHKFEKTPNHGKKVKGGILWDMKINAYGKEDLYETMKEKSRLYINNRTQTILDEMDEKAQGIVWIKEMKNTIGDTDNDLNYAVIFSDKTALTVRFTHFLDDINSRKGEQQKLDNIVEKEKNTYKQWFLDELKKK